MKYTVLLLLLVYISLPHKSFGQIDSIAIEFKAKLLTTSRFGIANPDTILSDILNQQVSFLNSASSNTILLKIDFNQRYFLGQDNHLLWLGDCSYYLAFNIRRSKFYRLAGFEKFDLKEFFNDFEAVDYNLFNKNSEIDFYCLKEYSKLSIKKKSKKTPCLPSCSTELKTMLVIPKMKN